MIPPVTVPIVQVNVLAALAVSARFGLVALHIDALPELVTTGVGLTVTVIVKGAPGHPPAVDVGVTIYCTLPAVVLLGLVSVWLIVPPVPALAPVIPPVIVPIVHANVLGVLTVRLVFGFPPLQIDCVEIFVITGSG